MTLSYQTYDESAQLDIKPESFCKIIGVPVYLVDALYVELVVTNQAIRLDYALVLGADPGAQCTTELPLLDDQGPKLHFGYIERADLSVQPNYGFGVSSDQTKPFYHALGTITDEAAERCDDYLVQNLDRPGSLSDFHELIPNKRAPVFNSWLLYPNRMLSRQGEWSIIYSPAATRDNELALTDDISHGLEPGEIVSFAAPLFPDVFQEHESPDDNRYHLLLICTAVIVMIATVGLSAHRMKKKFSG